MRKSEVMHPGHYHISIKKLGSLPRVHPSACAHEAPTIGGDKRPLPNCSDSGLLSSLFIYPPNSILSLSATQRFGARFASGRLRVS